MRIFSYVLMHDTGFAPCVQDGTLTLGGCKPRIRGSAEKGDYIVGFYGKSCSKIYGHSLAYMAKITDVIDYKTYYSRFKSRLDCIYDGKLRLIPNDYHTERHRQTDLNGRYVLVSDDFIFLGDKNIKIKSEFRGMIAGRGHKVNANDIFRKSFPEYFREMKEEHGEGVLGEHIHRDRIISVKRTVVKRPTKRKRGEDSKKVTIIETNDKKRYGKTNTLRKRRRDSKRSSSK